MLLSFAKWIHLMTFCCYSNGDQVAVVAKLFCKTSKWWVMICLPPWPDCVVRISLAWLWLLRISWRWHYSPSWCSIEYKQLQQGHFLLANSSALQLGGDLKVPFPVKVRAASAPWSLHSRASFFLLSYIPILRHPTKPQLNTEEHFYFP